MIICVYISCDCYTTSINNDNNDKEEMELSCYIAIFVRTFLCPVSFVIVLNMGLEGKKFEAFNIYGKKSLG